MFEVVGDVVGGGGGGAIKCTREAEIGMAELLEVGEACILLLSRQSMFRLTPGLKRRNLIALGLQRRDLSFCIHTAGDISFLLEKDCICSGMKHDIDYDRVL